MKNTLCVFSMWTIYTSILTTSLSAAEPADTAPLVLSKMGIFFVGGHEVEMPGGGRFGGGGTQTQISGQARVHYLIPSAERREGKLPVVMVPGMGLTSYIYLGTPDGREGWAQIFAKAGYPVYVIDEPTGAVSGFEVGPFNRVKAGDADASELPRIMLWSNEITWRRWGIGPEPGVPAENTRFPFERIDQLHASMTPVIGGGRGGGGAAAGAARFGGRRGGRDRGAADSPSPGRRPGGAREGTPSGQGGAGAGGANGGSSNVDALLELLRKVGPATLVLHSASGPTGFEAARRRGDLVAAIVAVEVTGSPTASDDITKHFADKRFVGVYGDNFDLRPMAGRYEATMKMAEEIRSAGGKADVISLPKLGIRGNSHLLMQDDNNAEIARMIMERLEARKP